MRCIKMMDDLSITLLFAAESDSKPLFLDRSSGKFQKHSEIFISS